MLPEAGIPFEFVRSWCGDELVFLIGNPEECLGEFF
jgi:hypothetical protein